MVYFEINKKNYESKINLLNKYLNQKGNHIFVLFYMEGCGPCNATRPEWSKLQNILSNDILNKEDIVILSIDHELYGKIKNVGSEPNSFPTIRYVTNNGKISENYEDSNISKKDRSIDSFIEWIKLKSKKNDITKSEHKYSKTKHNKILKGGSTRKKRGGKWSLKYKRSINCRRPKGFSQRQHCKYGRKK